MLRQENRLKRQSEIEQAAYALLREEGYGSISMLKIAKRAKASNETLYRWYGDKAGLFRALVTKNAEEAHDLLVSTLAGEHKPEAALERLGPVLLGILLGPHAIALNQAAAADPSGELGVAIAEAGRERIMPLIGALFKLTLKGKARSHAHVKTSAELYISLLVGDMQIRRVIGQMAAPDSDFLAVRAHDALMQFRSIEESIV